MELVKRVCRGIQAVTKDNNGLQRVTEASKKLKATRGLQGITRGYRGLPRGVEKGWRGLKRVTEV